jgi:2-phosphosulfolactate phosphatase
MSGATIDIDVALTPRLFGKAARPPTVVLVDVLRATSTVTTLFALGARSVEVPAGPGQARRLAAAGRVVCAEQRSGRQAPDARVPIAPSRLRPADVAGLDVVLWTTNGTRALRRVSRTAAGVMLGCLLNASAVAEAAMDLAIRLRTSVSVVCSGRWLGAIPCLDDTYAAGVIVEHLIRAATERGHPTACTDAARLAQLTSADANSPLDALSTSATGDILRKAGAEEDIAFCARIDVTDMVPVLVLGGAEARCPVVLL